MRRLHTFAESERQRNMDFILFKQAIREICTLVGEDRPDLALVIRSRYLPKSERRR
jgi:hypothetical protein